MGWPDGGDRPRRAHAPGFHPGRRVAGAPLCLGLGQGAGDAYGVGVWNSHLGFGLVFDHAAISCRNLHIQVPMQQPAHIGGGFVHDVEGPISPHVFAMQSLQFSEIVARPHTDDVVAVIAFVIVGYVKVLAPQELVRSWIGPESGLRGVLIGSVAGMLLPGGPYVVFPLIAALFQTGAGLGPTLAMITSWSSLALLTVSFELPFLGWRFTIIRLGLGLLLPPLIGLVGSLLFSG